MTEADKSPSILMIDKHRAYNTAYGAFPGFFGADLRRHLMLAKLAADKIGKHIRDPCAADAEQHE